ncbi:L-lactate dehydrogenase [Baekduia alba]|uniref:alpha-hydroxy acid oxidase n=1 Tax=Baekduia alba TaxID=2997333 RepID=UPI0023401D44|nr:alpha-hydroxy acid oxidase [Baekduia alba]WCB95343.1 L-lactate dehydrogenase [Baekduia alba]
MSDFTDLLRRQVADDVRRLGPALLAAREGGRGGRRAGRRGTIGELRGAARRALPRVVFDYLEGGAGDEVTLARNMEVFAALELLPRTLVDVADVELRTTLAGSASALPVVAAPMGALGLVHADGELALARAARAAGAVSAVSCMSSYALEEIAAAGRGGPLWFQTYMWRDRGLLDELVRRADAAGYAALVVTVDVPRGANRDRDRRNRFGVPPRATARSLLDGLRHPRWSAAFAARGRLRFGNFTGERLGVDDGPAALASFLTSQFDPSASWDDLERLRERWDKPLIVKGVLDPADAARCALLGADAIVVSNHGGRQLDHAPSGIGALPAVVDAVDGRAEVYVDGGVRRGGDVAKALALGAKGCMAGRALGYGLGVAGQAGAERALAILADELRLTLMLAGCPSVHDLGPAWVRRPVAVA